MVVPLFYIFALFCLITEPETIVVDGLTVDLIHRYAPMSPFYNYSKSPREHLDDLILSSDSSYQGIKLLLANKLETAAIIPNGGDYLMKVAVGTPPVELIAVASTASDLTWFQCKYCEPCYPQSTVLFNPVLSSSYKSLPCDSQHCSDIDSRHLNCDKVGNICEYWCSYGNSSTVTNGVMGSDTFSFTTMEGTKDSFVSPAFGCGYHQHGVFDGSASGLLALGGGPLSLIYQMGSEIEYRFSYCLADGNSNYTSKLTFGGLSDFEGVTIPYHFRLDRPNLYNLNLADITIGSNSLQVGREIILDMGTTFTYLNPSVFSSLKDMVNEAIGVKPVAANPSNGLLCYDARAGVLTPPDIVLQFLGGDITLKASNIFFNYNGVVCLSVVASDEDGDPMVLGNMAQVNFLVEYDLLDKTVTFSPKDCSQKSE